MAPIATGAGRIHSEQRVLAMSFDPIRRMASVKRNRDRDQRALDPAFEREQRRNPRERMIVGDSFDAFCSRQRIRLSHRLESAVTRIRNARNDEDAFESRK